MKKNKIVLLFVIFYLFIGYYIFLLGDLNSGYMSNNTPFLEKVTSAIIVMIGWPMFLIGKMFT